MLGKIPQVRQAFALAVVQAERFQFELRMRQARLGERIEPGEEMAEVAVGLDEANDASLGGGVRAGGGERMRVIGAEFKTLEEEPPGVIDRAGIVVPALVRASTVAPCVTSSMTPTMAARRALTFTTFANPKSRIFAWPRLVTKMFPGLISR